MAEMHARAGLQRVRLHSIHEHLSSPLRRGKRTVLWAPQTGLGFGNFLYLWLWAHTEQRRGNHCVVLTPENMSPWVARMPNVQPLTVRPEDVRLWDRRFWTWHQRFGVDFTRDEVADFVQACIAGTSLAPGPSDDAGLLTLNIRRGNYYSEPHFRGTYGFDIAAYVEIALNRAHEHARIHRIRIVSDEISWCEAKLDGTLRAYAGNVSYVASVAPQEHFREVATASRLIGTNSTFSYWGGYVSRVLHGPAAHVIMPRFHARLPGGPDAHQLDPEWDIVESIPGGWDA